MALTSSLAVSRQVQLSKTKQAKRRTRPQPDVLLVDYNKSKMIRSARETGCRLKAFLRTLDTVTQLVWQNLQNVCV
jgi:hypothetical protein